MRLVLLGSLALYAAGCATRAPVGLWHGASKDAELLLEVFESGSAFAVVWDPEGQLEDAYTGILLPERHTVVLERLLLRPRPKDGPGAPLTGVWQTTSSGELNLILAEGTIRLALSPRRQGWFSAWGGLIDLEGKPPGRVGAPVGDNSMPIDSEKFQEVR